MQVPVVFEAPQKAELVATWDETTEGHWLATQPECSEGSSSVPNGSPGTPNVAGPRRSEDGDRVGHCSVGASGTLCDVICAYDVGASNTNFMSQRGGTQGGLGRCNVRGCYNNISCYSAFHIGSENRSFDEEERR